MRKYDYKDVCLIPRQVSTLSSRDEIQISSELFPGVFLSTPIIASPMKDVVNGSVCKILRENGAYGILHRFCTIEEQVKEFNEAGKDCAAAIGINDDYLDRFNQLYNAGCRNFCIDVANGASQAVLQAISILLTYHQDSFFLVGNVASKEGFNWCSQIKQVKAVRVGIAGGGGCTTKNATGIYFPAFSLLQECHGLRGTIVADGGIREPQDFCKAIFAGAEYIMLGSELAKAKESPAEIMEINYVGYKVFRGSASFEIQQSYKSVPRYIEGKTTYLPYNEEPLARILARYMEGLKSSMSYMNARTFAEYRQNTDWCSIN